MKVPAPRWDAYEALGYAFFHGVPEQFVDGESRFGLRVVSCRGVGAEEVVP
ncbi:MAG: hypothetical protein ACK4P5_01095 [Fimbriimonadales bacterium]